MSSTMKAIQVLGDASSPRLTLNYSTPVPITTDAQLLIKVYSAGITGDELMWPELYKTPSRIPGHDVSGTIAALGPNYSGPLTLGQAVFAFLDAERGGAQAEYVLCAAEEVAPKPRSISHAEAAALLIPILTAWEAIVDKCAIQPGMKVLVTGASGAVGIVFIQLVNAFTKGDVQIVALASSRNHDRLKQLGATETVDYSVKGWESSIRDVDVVFDAAGGDALSASWATLKGTATLVTIADPAPPWAFNKLKPVESVKHPGVKYSYFVLSASAERMTQAAELIDGGALRPLVVTSFPFEEGVDAWKFARRRGKGSKVVIAFEN